MRRSFAAGLRQATSSVFQQRNGIPVSWYADDDWANVGRSDAWIEEDETLHLVRMVAARSITVGTVVKGEDGKVSMGGQPIIWLTVLSRSFTGCPSTRGCIFTAMAAVGLRDGTVLVRGALDAEYIR